jgi:hypothetical protein
MAIQAVRDNFFFSPAIGDLLILAVSAVIYKHCILSWRRTQEKAAKR